MILGRFHRRHAAVPASGGPAPDDGVIELDAAELSRVFEAPRWLRDMGLLAWFLVGVGLVLWGIVWLLGATSSIVEPVVAGGVVAAVASPIVAWLKGKGVPRAGGAAIVLLGVFALGVVILLLVLGGIVEQAPEIKSSVSAAVDKLEGWASDVGVDTGDTSQDVTNAANDAGKTLLTGIASGIQGLTSIALFLSFTLFTIFFLLKDGPMMRRWVDRHLGVPQPVASTITGNVVQSLRRYFMGVTIVAAFNGILVGLAAVILGVPLAGTIAVVTFVMAYIPFIGAFIAGAFAVLIALGTEGTTTAVIMLVVVILANGALQQIVQPIAFGATLDLNPLIVLIVTIGAGSLFGMVGLILAAPLTSAAVHITRQLAQARLADEAAEPGDVVPADP